MRVDGRRSWQRCVTQVAVSGGAAGSRHPIGRMGRLDGPISDRPPPRSSVSSACAASSSSVSGFTGGAAGNSRLAGTATPRAWRSVRSPSGRTAAPGTAPCRQRRKAFIWFGPEQPSSVTWRTWPRRHFLAAAHRRLARRHPEVAPGPDAASRKGASAQRLRQRLPPPARPACHARAASNPPEPAGGVQRRQPARARRRIRARDPRAVAGDRDARARSTRPTHPLSARMQAGGRSRRRQPTRLRQLMSGTTPWCSSSTSAAIVSLDRSAPGNATSAIVPAMGRKCDDPPHNGHLAAPPPRSR